jgi:hypothetical protein
MKKRTLPKKVMMSITAFLFRSRIIVSLVSSGMIRRLFFTAAAIVQNEEADQEEVDGEGDICKLNPGIGIGERGGEGDKTYQHQPYNVQPEERMIDKPDTVKLLVMEHPDDCKGEKCDHKEDDIGDKALKKKR